MVESFYSRENIALYLGDNREVIPQIPDAMSAVVTDPPYGLSFMGRDWDHGVPGQHFWEIIRSIMHPGAHLLAFGGSRTQHRLGVAIEDAGLEMRDTLMWLYGSGFPKSLDVGRAIDKAAGVERAVVGLNHYAAKRTGHGKEGTFDNRGPGLGGIESANITAPATDAARQWDGWGTSLKPSYEPIILARKPLSGTVAATVLAYGTGAINIDASRVGGGMDKSAGRWPPNVILDDAAAEVLDQQSGELGNAHRPNRVVGQPVTDPVIYGKGFGAQLARTYPDTGGASRFFPRLPVDDPDTTRFLYTAKASRKERGEGNNHPTVKPLALMRWLLTLVTPPSGVVLDPFAGSGSTLVAAAQLGISAVGIEMDAEYCAIAAARIDHALDERARQQAATRQADLFAQLVAD